MIINHVCISRWIVQAMKHELKISAGDMPPQDIYQLSPGDIKQLLLDVLQPQHTGRYSSNTRSHIVHPFSSLSAHRSAFEDTVIFHLLYNLF